jgi:hypothetical protein
VTCYSCGAAWWVEPRSGRPQPGRDEGRRRGTPVVAFNAGDRRWQESGTLSFYGEPEVLAGEYAGTKLNEIDAKHTLCVRLLRRSTTS